MNAPILAANTANKRAKLTANTKASLVSGGLRGLGSRLYKRGHFPVLKRLSILAAPLLIAACATDREANTLPPEAAKGKAFAQANCASCHAIDDGVSPHPNAISLRRAANRLPDWAVAASFERGIQVGHTMEMPEFVFEEDDINNLLAYFEVLKAKD